MPARERIKRGRQRSSRGGRWLALLLVALQPLGCAALGATGLGSRQGRLQRRDEEGMAKPTTTTTTMTTMATRQPLLLSRGQGGSSSSSKSGRIRRLLASRGGSGGGGSSLSSPSLSDLGLDLTGGSGSSSSGGGSRRKKGKKPRLSEWEAEAEWLTNQVMLYQAQLALSAEALGKRHAVAAATPYDLGFGGGEKYKPPLEIAEATEEQSYECRIHGEVEPGSKVVAPCQCRGTAKWMWFADMNRRRRRDPASSRTCGTCHAVIDYGAYQKFGSALCQAVSWPLDHPLASRAIIGAGVLLATLVAALPLSVVVVRILTSGLFWRQHGLWSRVLYGPLPLKVVLYRYIAQLLWAYFLRLEGAVRETLAEAESVLLERALPVTYPPLSAKPEAAAAAEES